MTTTIIRNLDEARTQVRQKAIRERVKALILEYGVDDVLEGLRFIYRENVFAKAKDVEAVRYRAGLLDEIVDRLRKGYGYEHPNGHLLRVRKKDRPKRTRFQSDHTRALQTGNEEVDRMVQEATAS